LKIPYPAAQTAAHFYANRRSKNRQAKERTRKMETRISTDQPVATLINVFTVDPANQQQLINVLIEATEQVMRNLPGFVSANIHRSLDGKRVTNYAQWRSEADFKAMLGNPAAAPHLQKCKELATYDANLYQVVHIDNRG
jgi:heme-degrading monooxygenase HmoA